MILITDDCSCKQCVALREAFIIEAKQEKTAEDRERLQKLYLIVLEA
jgi:hypothetical protein